MKSFLSVSETDCRFYISDEKGKVTEKDGKLLQVRTIGQFGKYHNTLCLSPQILHKNCFQFLLGLIMVPRENKNNGYAKFGGDKQRVLWYFPNWPICEPTSLSQPFFLLKYEESENASKAHCLFLPQAFFLAPHKCVTDEGYTHELFLTGRPR